MLTVSDGERSRERTRSRRVGLPRLHPNGAIWGSSSLFLGHVSRRPSIAPSSEQELARWHLCRRSLRDHSRLVGAVACERAARGTRAGGGGRGRTRGLPADEVAALPRRGAGKPHRVRGRGCPRPRGIRWPGRLPPVPLRVSQPCPLPASRCTYRRGGEHTGSGPQDPISGSGGVPWRSRRTGPAGAGSSPARRLREGPALGTVPGGAGTFPLQHDRVAAQELPNPVRAIARRSRRRAL